MELKNVNKSFSLKNERVDALKDINLKIEKGKFYAIIGHRGSGKSTLINVLGTIMKPDNGTYLFEGLDVKKLNDAELSQIRMKKIGFIFQNYLLDPHLKAYENVMLPMLINPEIKAKERKSKSLELLKLVGIEDRANHFPRQLSGGEQQRVAIARALANDPEIILADEPTGNLDKENEKIIFGELKKCSESGKSIVVVTHSKDIKDYADIVYEMDHGKLEASK